MNDKLNELFEKLQGDVSEEEGDAIIEQFQISLRIADQHLN